MDTQFEKAETHQKAEIDNKDYDVESYKFSDEDCEQCDEENMIDSPKDSRKQKISDILLSKTSDFEGEKTTDNKQVISEENKMSFLATP